jgi:uncharacterized integral membrane protein (TIGR00698 family)
MSQKSDPSSIGDLYGELWIADSLSNAKTSRRVSDYVPGLVVVAVAAVAATWLHEHYGLPAILGGLLVGLALNFISASPKVHLGLDVCSTSFLRWGIILLGTQVTLLQISSLGVASFAALLGIMTLVIMAGLASAKLTKQSAYIGWLAGGATAICGASAALAIYALIGRKRLSQEQFTYTLVGISLASAIAMSAYPILAAAFDFNDRQAGFLMGAAIHDVAQSLGGGYSFSEGAGEFATIVKMSRVALLAPVVALLSLLIPPEAGTSSGVLSKLKLPWFVLAFFAMVALNSVITLPAWVQQYGLVASKTLLLCAVAATAMRSKLDALLSQGWRPLVPVIMASLTAFAIAFCFAWKVL